MEKLKIINMYSGSFSILVLHKKDKKYMWQLETSTTIPAWVFSRILQPRDCSLSLVSLGGYWAGGHLHGYQDSLKYNDTIHQNFVFFNVNV